MFTLLRFLALVIIISCIGACSLVEKKEKEEPKKFSKEDRLDLAMMQEFKMTQDPALGYVPKERLLTAKKFMETLRPQNARINALSWQERGPNNVAGRIRALFIDRRDATGNTIFASSVSGGIWKATNFKNTPVWAPVSENMGSLAVCALAQDPLTPTTMYAGTGEGWFNIDAVRGNGIWKSIDGGTTWNQLPITDSVAGSTNFELIQDIVVNPAGVVFASSRPSRNICNRGGVYRSADGGVSWQRVIGTVPAGATQCTQVEDFYAADLEIASNGDLYVTTGFITSTTPNNQGKIFRSSASLNGANVGAVGTWVNITPAGVWERIELATSASSPGTLYGLFEQNNSIGSIHQSTDFGVTWQAVTRPTWCNQGTNSTDFTNGQAWYDLIVQVDPNNSNTLMIGGIDLFRSANGGTNWTQVSQWAANCGSLPNVHADQHNIIYYPGSSSEIISTNDGGIYYSTDGGTSWANRNGGLNITQFYGCDYHPTSADYFLAGAQDNGSQRFTSPGTNSTTRVTGGDGGIPHIDQTDGQIQVTAFVFNNYFWSRNGGTSFQTVPGGNNRGQFINPSDYSDAQNTLYAGDNAGSYFYITGFENATPVSSVNAVSIMAGREVTAVKVDPFADNTVWFGASFNNSVPMILKVSAANTSSPNVLIASTIPVAANANVSSIDIDPANASHILVAISNYGVNSIWESTDGGNSWNSIEGNFPDVPVRWAIFAGANSQLNGTTGGNGGILIGTELGVWTTSVISGSATQWIPNRSGMPNVRVDQLKYRNDGLVAAATHGRGLFTTTISGGGTTTSVPTVPNTRDFIRYISASNNLLVVAGNLNTRKIELQIFDMAGRLVHRSSQAYQTTTLALPNLSRGSYILRITGNNKEVFTSQFMKQ